MSKKTQPGGWPPTTMTDTTTTNTATTIPPPGVVQGFHRTPDPSPHHSSINLPSQRAPTSARDQSGPSSQPSKAIKHFPTPTAMQPHPRLPTMSCCLASIRQGLSTQVPPMKRFAEGHDNNNEGRGGLHFQGWRSLVDDQGWGNNIASRHHLHACL